MTLHTKFNSSSKLDRQAYPLSSWQLAPKPESSHKVVIRSLAIACWIESVILATIIYLAVRLNLAGTEWLAILLLGMIFLGWIMVAYYYHVSGR